MMSYQILKLAYDLSNINFAPESGISTNRWPTRDHKDLYKRKFGYNAHFGVRNSVVQTRRDETATGPDPAQLMGGDDYDDDDAFLTRLVPSLGDPSARIEFFSITRITCVVSGVLRYGLHQTLQPIPSNVCGTARYLQIASSKQMRHI
ncbi:hypothetical protein U1Q18_038526 [Sarracenia purpurea var. burkii]